MAEPVLRRGRCEELPVLWVEPAGQLDQPDEPGQRTLALWLTHLGGSKEQTIPMLEDLARAGCVAVSVDPWLHGERGDQQPREQAESVLGDFRHRMWPILGQTTLDCLRVIDWARQELAPDSAVVAGGVSMGGDISVALAGVDPRVSRVAALVATPDWTRPGMRELTDPEVLVDQGRAGSYAQWFYDHLDPVTHLDRYRRDVAIAFECGARDAHVPSDGATKFRDGLLAQDSTAGERVRITLHPGADHFAGATAPAALGNALDWLTGPASAVG